LLLLGDLRNVIRDGQLELHYQPKFTADDLVLTGVEALVRWRHPTRGLLPPDDFIPLAEHTGLIGPLTLEVLRRAARQWRAWHADGIQVSVAVNLSPANLLDNQFVGNVDQILTEEGLPAASLTLEITEGSVMIDPARSIGVLESLAAMGIDLSIDDYGIGHSSLAYLSRLPVHELKIDRAFIKNLCVSPTDRQIVSSTIELAHGLGLRVVAEGVEDADALELVQADACDIVQGFHLGRPVPADALLEQLRDHAWRAPAPTYS
jgi:EAL domain-containing protein (putative c-di-GMP-specific phosphodiesterase class I)